MWLLERECSRRIIEYALRLQTLSAATFLAAYIGITRLLQVRPARGQVDHMRTKELIAELQARGIDHRECVEREDLLEALCGPRLPPPQTAQSSGAIDYFDDEPTGDADNV